LFADELERYLDRETLCHLLPRPGRGHGADVELQECSSQPFFKRLAHRRNPLLVNHQALGDSVRSDEVKRESDRFLQFSGINFVEVHGARRYTGYGREGLRENPEMFVRWTHRGTLPQSQFLFTMNLNYLSQCRDDSRSLLPHLRPMRCRHSAMSASASRFPRLRRCKMCGTLDARGTAPPDSHFQMDSADTSRSLAICC
jgi:hypothetical protein